ncbi:ABC transporter permease [Breoghania sp. L-A4]|uniref:ABC transporter permease n=1 Tax=Breoghania sp. L-A4 TaxID=2304600 RepID=UPI000E35ADF2|nr:ABC transporter permease [Breoghania sp. L-A4]AXS39325.1 ABC transporter permease [Breoghania sp. L-A4]
MTSLIKSYGRGLTAVFTLLTLAWIFGLILLPQIRMIERAFIYEDRGGEAAQLTTEINSLYERVFTIDQRLKALETASDGPAPATPGLPAPGFSPSPSLAPSPSMPATPSFGPSPGLVPSPSAGTGAIDVAALRAEKAEIEARLETLEAQEKASAADGGVDASYSVKNFTSMSGLHLKIFVSSLGYAFCVTLLSFLVCYPVAYAVATTKSRERVGLIMLGLVIPYAINELLRIFAWVMILEKQGILNALLDALGLIDMSAGEGYRFVASNGAVFTVMMYTYVLFMVFPIYNTIDTLDKNQIEAARDLGASTWRIHWRVVLPHAKPGIAVGAIMTFMLSAGSIAAPEIVGRGLHPDWFSQVIYRQFFEADSWNQGSAYSVALLVACIAFVLINMAVFRVGIREIAK